VDREEFRKYLPLVIIGLVICLAAVIHFASPASHTSADAQAEDQAEDQAAASGEDVGQPGASGDSKDPPTPDSPGSKAEPAASSDENEQEMRRRPLPPQPREGSGDDEAPPAETAEEPSEIPSPPENASTEPPLPPLPLEVRQGKPRPLEVAQAAAAMPADASADETPEESGDAAASQKRDDTPAEKPSATEKPAPEPAPLPPEPAEKPAPAEPEAAPETEPAREDKTQTATTTTAGVAQPEDLPVDAAALMELEVVTSEAIRNVISLEQLRAAIGDGDKGLQLDLSGISRLLDDTTIDPSQIYGRAHLGPYPYEAKEADFAYKRFRRSAGIDGGKARLDVGYLLDGRHNSEDWTDRGTVVLRLELFLAQPGEDRPLGIYDTFFAFCKTDDGYRKLPWLVEGPLVCQVTSKHPDRATLSFTTDEPVAASVMLSDGRQFSSPKGTKHLVPLHGLQAGQTYRYWVQVGRITTKPYELETAPLPGAGPVVFAYCGDSREGVGGGMQNYMGMNYSTLHRLAAIAYRHEAEFFLMGGDLINGYTTSSDDFAAQLFAWKQAMSGFWHERAVYPAMGNHEALLRTFKGEGGGRIRVDRWPYASQSAEAIFADAFVNPEGAPPPADPRRPSYEQSVFAAQYGMVKFIAFNNNYWYSNEPEKYGGCPEGYIMDDQLDWIERQLGLAEADPTVRYVLLFAQEPVFPCGGHVADAMWYDGNNRVRAFTYRAGRLEPAADGIIDVRNRLARAVAASSKVAAVLAGDEHAYHRVLIGPHVPVGDPQRDDADGDGELDWRGDEPASPLAALKRPTWYLTCGGGGAPYYSAEPTPWTNYWNAQPEPHVGYYYSSQENVFVFQADEEGISVDVYNPYGERIDGVEDLTAAKR
jgi:hypothetical protein